MTNSTRSSTHPLEQDPNLWENLKRAIASSSGFKRWQEEQEQDVEDNFDESVCTYLRETLETLAY